MRALVPCRSAWLLSVVLALTSPAITRSAPPLETPETAPSSSRPVSESILDADSALQRALELERQRNWQAAIHAYEEAQEHWPSRSEFTHRRRLCETHYKLVRRY